MELVLVGRSSSHFTRVARMFALELGVPFVFRPVLDLTSRDTSVYEGNPALKIPVWVDEEGSLFGCENICRALVRRAKRSDVVLRGDCAHRLVANAEELTLHAMSTEVTIIMSKAADASLPQKVHESLQNTVRWLDEHVDAVRAELPARSFSFFEIALFCLVTHLPWREVMEIDAFPRLVAFRDAFGTRASARATEYRFDQD